LLYQIIDGGSGTRASDAGAAVVTAVPASMMSWTTRTRIADGMSAPHHAD
jgi:hypothetical protein